MFNAILGKLMPESPTTGPASPTSPPDSDSDVELLQSIERSRKRNLSPGLMRGDEVADRLIAQEVSASPALKKSRPSPSTTSPEMAMSMADFEKYMKRNVESKLSVLEEGLGDMRNTVGKIDKNVKANNKKLDRHQDQIKTNSDAILDIRSEIRKLNARPEVADRPDAQAVPVNQQETRWVPRSHDAVTDEDFFRARRSLRLWPINGITTQDMRASAKSFLRDTLGLRDLADSCIEDVSRPRLPSGLMTKSEVLIRFNDASARDTVMGASSRLAGHFDGAGKPTAGLRIEVPSALLPTFKTLERYGQQLRSRHGQGTRRHVKFDELDRSLYLNVKLPGDERWSKVPLEVARRGVKTREKLASEELERRFDIAGPPARDDRPCSASASSSASTNPNLMPLGPIGPSRLAPRQTEMEE